MPFVSRILHWNFTSQMIRPITSNENESISAFWSDLIWLEGFDLKKRFEP